MSQEFHIKDLYWCCTMITCWNMEPSWNLQMIWILKICIELKWLLLLVLSNGPTLLKFLERLIFFFKVSLSDEAQIYLSCSKYFISRTWRLFPVTATDEGLTKSLGDCFLFKNLFKVSNLFLNKTLLN